MRRLFLISTTNGREFRFTALPYKNGLAGVTHAKALTLFDADDDDAGSAFKQEEPRECVKLDSTRTSSAIGGDQIDIGGGRNLATIE